MKQILVGNVDCESQCGEPERRSLKERWESVTVGHRLLWLVRDPEDVIVLPAPISRAMLAYAGDVLGLDLTDVTQVAPAGARPRLLTESVLGDLRVDAAADDHVDSYFVDPGLRKFCNENGVDYRWPEPAIMQSLNRKSHFRWIAEQLGVPVARGATCVTAPELCAAIRDLIGDTGTVIVKQDLAGGGEGNVALTLDVAANEFAGTSRTRKLNSLAEIEEVARELLFQLTGPLNDRLIVEVLESTAEVLYAELDVNQKHSHLKNWGTMRMQPKWVGFVIPSATEDLGERMAGPSLRLGDHVAGVGYSGLMNVDAIVTRDGRLLFTEINVRLGGCTHVDVVARRLVGEDYMRKRVLRTLNQIRFAGPFASLVEKLAPWRFDAETQIGALVLTESLEALGTFEILVIATSHDEASRLEQSVLESLC